MKRSGSRKATRRLFALATAATTLGAALFAPTGARAYERQWHAGGGVSYAVITGEPSLHGVGPTAHLTYGLTDAFNFVFELQGTLHPAADLGVVSASAGVAYVFDVLQWVPYVGLMAGGYFLDIEGARCLANCSATRIGGSVPFGLDYQVSRSFAVGFTGRDQLLFGGGGVTHLLTLGLRVEAIWGY